MGKAGLLIAALTLLSGSSLVWSEISFQDNGYTNVVVTVSPDVPKENAQSVVDGIKVRILNTFSQRNQ